MRVIGTAGHVDHGKSTLVRALTGIDPDRLQEEQARGMTIDLGFAWFDLVIPPDNEPQPIGIVDVPGHIDFIKNMLAGVGGIDAAVLVIAADEGVMPQTKEHLDILKLLDAPSIVTAMTKIDMVDDPEWLDLVELDIGDLLADTQYADSPIVRVSPVTGQGMDEFRTTLARTLSELPTRRNRSKPRLPIDRIFSISGFGTIVTGTLSDGRFSVGEAVSILPEGLDARIRGMQTHQQQVDVGEPGSRLAINLSHVGKNQLQRGSVVVYPGSLTPTTMLDVHFDLLSSAPKSITHNTVVSFFTGAAETTARIRLLGQEMIAPGESGWLQLRLEQPIVAAAGDRYILRQPSPSLTLGGGAIVDPHPSRRWRRFDAKVISRLETLAEGTPEDILLGVAAQTPLLEEKALIARSGLDVDAANLALYALLQSGALRQVAVGNERYNLTLPQMDGITDAVIRLVTTYHTEYPLRTGIPRSELLGRLARRTNISLENRQLSVLLQQMSSDGLLVLRESDVAAVDFEIRLSDAQQQRVNLLMDKLKAARASPPNLPAQMKILEQDEPLFQMLIDSGQLVRIREGIIFRTIDFDCITGNIHTEIERTGSITLAQVRDMFDTSRKYAQAILEELDDRGVTKRVGDERVLR